MPQTAVLPSGQPPFQMLHPASIYHHQVQTQTEKKQSRIEGKKFAQGTDQRGNESKKSAKSRFEGTLSTRVEGSANKKHNQVRGATETMHSFKLNRVPQKNRHRRKEKTDGAEQRSKGETTFCKRHVSHLIQLSTLTGGFPRKSRWGKSSNDRLR